MPDSRILLGVIGRAHGVRGLVRVTSHTADPAGLTTYGPLTDAKGRRFALRWRGEGVAEVTELVGDAAVKVTDRNVAERLTNTPLYIERTQLPPPDEDEFYLTDLIGLPAFDPAGAALGRVAVVHDYGAGTSIEIERDHAPALIVPFTQACVPVVDVAAGRVVVVVPEEVREVVASSPSPGGGVCRQLRSRPMSWRASVLTLFPEMFPGPIGLSLAGRALETGIWSLDVTNIRDFAPGRHRSVDDTPFGGGAGMVLRPDVVDAAIAAVADDRPLVCLTPRGRPFAQADARRFAAGPGLVLLCGRYEGIDQRVIEARLLQEFSIGDYVLSGGELPALVLLDAVVRLLPGVMGAADSATEESFSTGLLEYPHYTRPAEWNGRRVPDVLLSGHHAAVAAWRQAEAERTTRDRRPDLWAARTATCQPTPALAPQ